MFKKLIALLLLSTTSAWAGLPPTTSKGSGDTSDLVTLKFRFPNFTVTHSGPTATFNVLSAAGGGTGLSSLTAHCVVVGAGVGNASLVCPSSSGQVLTDNGAGADPSFQALPAAMTSLTGEVTASGPGASAATIANSAVTNAKMANMSANTIKGNNTGSPAAPSDLTATQVTAMLNAFVGDSGSGGTKGLVPGPASGDAAANKYLKADGTWATVPGGLTSPLTNKGDVWVWSTTDARLPVGTDGQVLSADSTQTTGLKWIAAPSASPTIFGSRGTPRSIVAATGITSGASHMSTTAVNQKIYVSGSGGAVTVTANPAISAHTVDGAEMKICGRDDTNTVTLTNGNGLSLNGSVTLGADDCITLSWDTTNYVEVSRSN